MALKRILLLVLAVGVAAILSQEYDSLHPEYEYLYDMPDNYTYEDVPLVGAAAAIYSRAELHLLHLIYLLLLLLIF